MCSAVYDLIPMKSMSRWEVGCNHSLIHFAHQTSSKASKYNAQAAIYSIKLPKDIEIDLFYARKNKVFWEFIKYSSIIYQSDQKIGKVCYNFRMIHMFDLVSFIKNAVKFCIWWIVLLLDFELKKWLVLCVEWMKLWCKHNIRFW